MWLEITIWKWTNGGTLRSQYAVFHQQNPSVLAFYSYPMPAYPPNPNCHSTSNQQILRLDRIPILWKSVIFLTACPYFPPWKYWVTIQNHGKLINCNTGLGPHWGYPELTPSKSLNSAGLIWINLNLTLLSEQELSVLSWLYAMPSLLRVVIWSHILNVAHLCHSAEAHEALLI